MKLFFCVPVLLSCVLYACKASSQPKPQQLYLDVHYLEPGKVTFKDVAAAHEKDLATQGKYNVKFLKFWVDETNGNVYCLSSALDSPSIRKTHQEAHGLLPQEVMLVTDGFESPVVADKDYYLDIHEFGAGHVKAQDVAVAHAKDLVTQQKYGVNFVNYWVNAKDGVVVCLSQAKDSSDVIKTHKEAHGLLPTQIMKVKQGQ
jgi:hypothetical protein